ncbi:hypothetical protein PhCBS80983_g01154 [Powellomyces hirtus]|uniref:Uncharacterized protein n=1 Tax=Powellomyces hirtus TaxID=109895 RepID=A0A507EDM2_9FUNG|nr:hypothetical protein PhCBS80983_g01154 [Powellomyces hirtus]
MLMATENAGDINVPPSILDMGLIMRLHQFAYNPSVHKPNPYVDVSKLNLDPYMADMFGQDVLSQAQQEIAEAASSASSIDTTGALDESPERLSAAAWLPVTPMNNGPVPLFHVNYPSDDQLAHAKQTAAALKICTGPTPPPTCASSPHRELFAAKESTARPIPLRFMSVFAQDSSSTTDDDTLSSQESFSQETEDDTYEDLPCPSSDFSQDQMSSPMVFHPPFHGFPAPEDAMNFGTFSYGGDYTPAPVRYVRLSSEKSDISPPLHETKRKRYELDDKENDEPAYPKMSRIQKVSSCSRCKLFAHKRKSGSRPSTKRSQSTTGIYNDVGGHGKDAEWRQSSFTDYTSSSFSDFSRSSPIPFERVTSPSLSSLYDSDSDVASSMHNPSNVYLTPVTGTKPVATTSPPRHFVSPLNIFAPEKSLR